MNNRHHLTILSIALAGIVAICAIFGTAHHSLVSAAPKSSTPECRWTDTPIILDGKDDDSAWKNAQVIDSFGQAWLGEKAPALRGKTKAKLLRDRDYLYFFAEMQDRD